MRIKVKAFRQLLEAAMTTADAESAELAVTVYDDDAGTLNVLMYDPKKLLQALSAGVSSGDDPIGAIEKNATSAGVGIVGMHKPTSEEGPSYGGMIVHAAAAKKGYGPLLFMMAATLAKIVVPDRDSVSAPAKAVVDKFANMPGIKKRPLDDISNPKTPDPDDDSKIYPGGESNALNYAYSLPPIDVPDTLLARHEQALASYNSWLKKNGLKQIDSDSWNDGLALAMTDYFQIAYSKVR